MFKIAKSLFVLMLFFAFLTTPNAVSQNTILWSVENPNQTTKSYILGTYHQIGNSFVDSIPEITQYLYSSELAVFESLGSEKELRRVMNNRVGNLDFQKQLKKSDVENLKEISSDWAVPISKLTPMELLTKLSQTYFKTKCGSVKPSDTWDNFDKYLIHLAEEKNIKLFGLESDSIQLNYINDLNKGNIRWEDLRKTIHEWTENIIKSKNVERNCSSVYAYMNFELNYELDKECGENPLIQARNDSWVVDLLDILPKKNTFVAVGLLHLYGKCGLISQLRDKGYILKPIDLR